jgi:hypothetical protein
MSLGVLDPAVLNGLTHQLDPSILMEDLGFFPDEWQRRCLRSVSDRVLLLCARQTGKSTTTAILSLLTGLYQASALVLLVSPSLRQSGELFRKVVGYYDALGRPLGAVEDSATTLALSNHSRIVSLPCNPATIRGFSGPRLVVIDEAALCPDDLFATMLPMLAVSRGRLVCLSTPMGQRGFFFEQWESGIGWERIKATAVDCPRIAPEFLFQQRQLLGDRWYRQEYMCSFEETLHQVFSTESVLAAFTSSKRPLFESSEAAPVAPDTISSKASLFGVGG